MKYYGVLLVVSLTLFLNTKVITAEEVSSGAEPLRWHLILLGIEAGETSNPAMSGAILGAEVLGFGFVEPYTRLGLKTFLGELGVAGCGSVFPIFVSFSPWTLMGRERMLISIDIFSGFSLWGAVLYSFPAQYFNTGVSLYIHFGDNGPLATEYKLGYCCGNSQAGNVGTFYFKLKIACEFIFFPGTKCSDGLAPWIVDSSKNRKSEK